MTRHNIVQTKLFGRRSYLGAGYGALQMMKPPRGAANGWKIAGVVVLGLAAAALVGMAALENLVGRS